MAGPLTTQTIQEEARAAPTEERALQLRGTDFYLSLGGQPRISERKSWRAPIVTEQGNPGIYVQIDKWLPLYKGNIYVVDEVTGQMYLSKGEHLMRIAETASHHPFQDHELGTSRHVPEREYVEASDQPVRRKLETDPGRGNLDPITPIVGEAGGMGRTPIPVTESTRQPEWEIPTPGDISERKDPEYREVPLDPRQSQEGTAEGGPGVRKREELEWALPELAEPCRPPGGSTAEGEGPSQAMGEQGKSPLNRSILLQSNG